MDQRNRQQTNEPFAFTKTTHLTTTARKIENELTVQVAYAKPAYTDVNKYEISIPNLRTPHLRNPMFSLHVPYP